MSTFESKHLTLAEEAVARAGHQPTLVCCSAVLHAPQKTLPGELTSFLLQRDLCQVMIGPRVLKGQQKELRSWFSIGQGKQRNGLLLIRDFTITQV